MDPTELRGLTMLLVSRHSHPREFPPDVRALMETAERSNYESGPGWYANLADTVFTADPNVHFYVLHKQNTVLAVLPLRAVKGSMGTRVESLSNYYTSLFEPVLAPEAQVADLAFLLVTLRKELGRIHQMKLAPMDPEGVAYRKLLPAMRLAGLLPFEYFCFGNWFLRTSETWSDYLKGRDGSVRSTMKRMGKRFDEAGGRLELIADASGLERGLAAYRQVYSASWKTAEPYAGFVPGLMTQCAEQGSLLLGLAWMGEEPIAAQLWIVSHGKASIYKLAYNEAFKSCAPGTLLTARLLQHVFERGDIAEIDYLIGDDAYKKQWMNGRRERWGIVAFNPWLPQGLAGALFEGTARLFKALRGPHGRPPAPIGSV